MSDSVSVNDDKISYKGSMGLTQATVPDVCKTPSPGGPIPVPYPNISMDTDLADGSMTVLVHGKVAGIKGSTFGRSSGDEAGTAGGVKSGVNMKEAEWLTYSFDVKIEGKNVCRHSDRMTCNKGNTVSL
jgi:uncharacterized Zn-binding protein involved in type VI secretion